MLFLQIFRGKKPPRALDPRKSSWQFYLLQHLCAFNASSASCFFVVCCSSASVGGVGGGECSYTIGCRTASSSSESVAVCFGPLSHTARARVVSHRKLLRQTNVSSQWHRAAVRAAEWYLVLRVSRQDGRYLSNSMVRLAFSDWTSLLSIQLATGGFQPRSAGLIYRIPVKKMSWSIKVSTFPFSRILFMSECDTHSRISMAAPGIFTENSFCD